MRVSTVNTKNESENLMPVREILAEAFNKAELSREYLEAMELVAPSPKSHLERELMVDFSSPGSGLLAHAYRALSRHHLGYKEYGPVFLFAEPLDGLIMVHCSNRGYFEAALRAFGYQNMECWKVFNGISDRYLRELSNYGSKRFTKEAEILLKQAVRGAGFLYQNIAHKSFSDEALHTLERLVVLNDFEQSAALRKLASAHFKDTRELLCQVLVRQLEAVRPLRPDPWDKEKPCFLETLIAKPEYFLDKEAAASNGIDLRSTPGYFRLSDALRGIAALEISRSLPGVHPEIAASCLEQACDKACIVLGAKRYAHYSFKAASLALSAGRFFTTWTP